jgi:hypothetical protein
MVLKPSSTSPKTLSFVGHMLIPGVFPQLLKLYRNVALQQLTGVAVEFLFARFTWTVFSFSEVFLQPGVAWILCICQPGQSTTREFSDVE